MLLGYERIKTNMDSWGASQSNITDPYYTNYQGSYANISPVGNVLSENALLSYFTNLKLQLQKQIFLEFKL